MAAVIGNASGDAQGSAPGYADALQRAREIAAKIQPENPGPMGDFSQKRPLEDADEPGAKKLASQNDLGPSLGMMQQGLQPGGRANMTENFCLPDKLVGLVIGKGGENISRLQAETGCRIQIAQDCQGMEDRPCTLTGTPEQITICRGLLEDIINKANLGVGGNNGLEEMTGQTVIQLMIPPDKCGLIIGKGGETIKSLQQNIGVKMMLIQDTTQNTGMNKPLRISGDVMKVEQAKQEVERMMAQRDAQNAQMQQQRGGAGGGGQGGGGGRGFDNYSNGPSKLIPVPKPAVGVVIGKGGDMISRIQTETRTRVQFKQEDEDPNVPHRMCNITGSPECIQAAIERITELIQSVQEHDGGAPGMGVGFGPGRGRGRGGGFGQWEGPGMGRGGRSGPGLNTVEYNVPTNKTGLVIGKGGENIRQINQQSQAHVEIQRNPPPGSDQMFKTFIIKGTPEQISLAQQLIQEKVDGGPGGPSTHGSHMHMGPPGGHGAPHGGPPGGPMGFGPPPPQGNFGGPPPGAGFGPPQGPPQQSQPPQQYQGQQPWGAAPSQYQWQQPGAPQQNGTAPADPSKPPDTNAAAWANYFYYQNQGQQPAAAAAAAGAAAYQPTAAATPSAVPGAAAGAQPDYTKAWEEYYKKQAEAAAAAAGTSVAAIPSAAAVAPAAPQAATTAAGGADYSAAWAEYYRQYSQYYQQAQAQAQYPAGAAAPTAPGQ